MSKVKFGWSSREFSMDVPVSIPGQMIVRISEGVHDPLTVTALCIDGGPGQNVVVMCSCDVASLPQPVIDMVGERVAKECPELPATAVIMNATHTHTSMPLHNTPSKTGDNREVYPWEKSREHFVDVCTQTICEAYRTRRPGGMAYGYGYAVVGQVRRTVYLEDVSKREEIVIAPNGHGVMYGDSKDPMFSHFETGADHTLNVMFTFDEAQKLTGMVVNVPCPSQVNGMMRMLSADYWHDVRKALKAKFGEDVFVLAQCAAAGDVTPRPMFYYKAHARKMGLKYGLNFEPGKMGDYNRYMADRRDIAQQILTGVCDVYEWASKDIQTDFPVHHVCKPIKLSKRMITPEEKARCEETITELEKLVPDDALTAEQNKKRLDRRDSAVKRNREALERYRTQNEEPEMETVIHAVRLGDIAFATNRFELFQDYMHRIQARSPYVQTFVVQLAGAGWGSYLPTERAVKNKGYSASLFCNKVGFEGGQELVEHTLDVLNELAEKE